MDKFVDALNVEEGGEFTPYALSLEDYIVEEGDDSDELTLRVLNGIKKETVNPVDLNLNVIAIDSSGVRLGEVQDGVVGAIRATVVTSTSKNSYKIQRYGPYLIKATNQNSKDLYNNLRRVVFGATDVVEPPSPYKIIDRARSFLEKIIQYNVVMNHSNALILFDGSLIHGTVDTPTKFVKEVLKSAENNENDIVAISKRTRLTLKRSRRSILSILENDVYPAYANVTNYIEQDTNRYLGEIYVCRFIYGGMAFRTDIPRNTPTSHDQLIGYLSRLCSRIGYPEELRLAHTYSKITQMEYIGLQSAATYKFRMKFRDRDVRRELFGPFR